MLNAKEYMIFMQSAGQLKKVGVTPAKIAIEMNEIYTLLEKEANNVNNSQLLRNRAYTMKLKVKDLLDCNNVLQRVNIINCITGTMCHAWMEEA